MEINSTRLILHHFRRNQVEVFCIVTMRPAIENWTGFLQKVTSGAIFYWNLCYRYFPIIIFNADDTRTPLVSIHLSVCLVVRIRRLSWLAVGGWWSSSVQLSDLHNTINLTFPCSWRPCLFCWESALKTAAFSPPFKLAGQCDDVPKGEAKSTSQPHVMDGWHKLNSWVFLHVGGATISNEALLWGDAEQLSFSQRVLTFLVKLVNAEECRNAQGAILDMTAIF